MKPPGVGGMWLETPRAGGSSSPPGFPTGLCGAGVSDKYRPLLDGKATQKSLESQNGWGWKERPKIIQFQGPVVDRVANH